jgi:hypothetical protein
MVPIRDLKRLAGKGGWVMSVVPKAAWTIKRIWAAVTSEERLVKQIQVGSATRTGGGGQRHSLIALKQVEPALKWIAAFWGNENLVLARKFRLTANVVAVELELDASPWALGGFLVTAHDRTPLQYYADPLGPLDFKRFKANQGDSSGQQVWEALNVLCAVRLWAPLIKEMRATVRIRADSVTALQMATKLSSRTPALNGIGAELALTLETFDIAETFQEHLPGAINRIADALSRLNQPGSKGKVPLVLAGAKCKQLPTRDDAFYKVWDRTHVGESSISMAKHK